MKNLMSIRAVLLRRSNESTTARRVLYLAIAICAVNANQSCSGYVFTNVADTVTAAPIGFFSGFGAPAISGSTLAFRGFYNGGHGIFITNGGPTTTVAKTGDAATSGTFAFFLEPSFSDGVAAFRAVTTTGESLFIGSGGAVTDLGYRAGREPAISGATLAFTTSIAGAEAVVSGIPSALNPIALAGEPAPEGTFTFFGYPAVSGSNVAFYGGYLKENGEEGEGVFTSIGGVVTTIIDRNGAAAFSYGPTSISGNTVAFYSQLTNGIYKGSGGAITKIVEEGDTAPTGMLGGFGNPSISREAVAFWGAGTGGSGIFLGSGGPLSTVIKTGDPLFGSTVLELFSGSFALDPRGGSMLAFQYRLTDGRSGVAIAFPVPEPGALTLLFVTVLGGRLLRTAPQRNGGNEIRSENLLRW